jgi:hypothetical protein
MLSDYIENNDIEGLVEHHAYKVRNIIDLLTEHLINLKSEPIDKLQQQRTDLLKTVNKTKTTLIKYFSNPELIALIDEDKWNTLFLLFFRYYNDSLIKLILRQRPLQPVDDIKLISFYFIEEDYFYQRIFLFFNKIIPSILSPYSKVLI